MLDIAVFERDAETFCRAAERERYLHYAGLKATLDFESLFADFEYLFHPDAYGELLEAELEPRPKRYLLDFVATGYLAEKTRALDERLAAAEAAARVVWDDRELPYRLAPVVLANEPDAHRRHDLAARHRAATAALNPLHEERHRTVLEALGGIGSSSYVALYDELRDLRYADLVEAGERFLAATDTAYFGALEELLGTIELAPADAAQCDLAWLFRARALDPYFPAKTMLFTLYRALRGLGLDIEQATNVSVDVEARALKIPRAFCARLDVPRDVRLVLQPTGGRLDYRALFHQAGHAEHYANVDRTLAFPDRWLGDYSVTEGYGYLFEHLLMEPSWVRPALDVAHPADYLRLAQFERLYGLRRQATMLLYARALHAGDDYEALAQSYAELFTRTLGVEHAPEPFLADVEPGLYAAIRLRAEVFEAQLRQYLQREYDEEWFRVPRAGRFLRDLWREGQKYPVDELARFMGYPGLDFRLVTEELRAGVA
ncbi:MAG TPA: hypothetical protein VK066_15140 [Chloroflexota bacterium]|nr:hypothetical protein [Chloroflexota bacterium]